MNPINDMNAVASALTEAAFDVTTFANPSYATASTEIFEFINRVSNVGRSARIDAVLFYFAGHALQHRAENHLLLSDFTFGSGDGDISEAETYFGSLMSFQNALDEYALRINDLISALNQIEAETYIFIFDACRNSPIEGLVDSQGLAEIVAGPNNYVVFSATPGSVALDGNDGNSPFSRALAARIPYQGIPIEVTIQGVRRDVYLETDGFQLPWDSSSLMYPFSFIPLGPFGHREPLLNISDQERALWQQEIDADFSVSILRRYLFLFPNGSFAEEARSRLMD